MIGRLPAPVARLTYLATALLVPWPAAIGYRRFYQGVLVRHKLTRRVAYGTVVRLASMATVGSLLGALSPLPGVCVGAAALSAGVVMEAMATRVMARGVVKGLLKGAESRDGSTSRLTTISVPAGRTSSAMGSTYCSTMPIRASG